MIKSKIERYEALINDLIIITSSGLTTSPAYINEVVTKIPQAVELYFQILKERNNETFVITNYYSQSPGIGNMSALVAFVSVVDIGLQIESTGAYPGLINDYAKSFHKEIVKSIGG